MRILVFGDDYGLPQVVRHMPLENIIGLVGAGIRPSQHEQLRRLAKGYGLLFLIQPRITDSGYLDFVKEIGSLKPDLIFVNSYSMLLRDEILSIPSLGCVNVHGALLPQYRGSNPIQWALLNNESETGVTMHYMDENFDTGDIIAQRRVPIYFENTWRDVQARIADATENMLAEELPKLLAGSNARQPQDSGKAHYYKRRHPEDGLINWNGSVLYIYNLIRALVKPHPGAFFLDADGQRVVLDEYRSILQVTGLKYSKGGGMLRKKHIILTPLDADDLPKLWGWINEREQVLFNAPYKPVHENQHREWFEAVQRRNDIVIFGIRLRETNMLIGVCQLRNIDYIHRNAELQIRIGEVAQRGQGYRTEAVKLLLDFAFKDLNLHRVSLHVFGGNLAAVRAYEKAGFVKEGLLRHAAHIDGQYVDVHVMGILREGYV